MHKNLKITLVIFGIVAIGFGSYYFFVPRYTCWPYCSNMTDEDREKIKEQMKDAGCPDEKIINKMPGSPESSYYIKNGKRKEISDYDNVWVVANCDISTQEVY